LEVEAIRFHVIAHVIAQTSPQPNRPFNLAGPQLITSIISAYLFSISPNPGKGYKPGTQEGYFTVDLHFPQNIAALPGEGIIKNLYIIQSGMIYVKLPFHKPILTGYNRIPGKARQVLDNSHIQIGADIAVHGNNNICCRARSVRMKAEIIPVFNLNAVSLRRNEPSKQ